MEYTLKIVINSDNSAFEPDCGMEVARILRELAQQAEDAGNSMITNGFRSAIMDINGNKVGFAES